MIQKLILVPYVRYAIAGLCSYAIELSFLLTLHKIIGLSAEVATGISFWIGLCVSFSLQKILAFKNYQKELDQISKQIGAYVLLVMFNYTFTLIVVSMFPDKWLALSRTAALIITTIWNFLIYKRIFNSNKPVFDVSKYKHIFKSIITSRKLYLGLGLSLPVLIFYCQYLFSGNKNTLGDFDYYAQVYEAFRISVVKYHQLPVWNPWMAGGLPLLSNPQFGLISIQSVLVLLFGTIYGLKLAYITYALLGFWGMYTLCRRVFNSPILRSAFISYIWIFSGFFVGHGISHFTFTSFFLLPWLVLFLAARRNKWSWLGLGITESVILLSSIHYAFLVTCFAILVYLGISVITKLMSKIPLQLKIAEFKKDILFCIKSAGVVVILAGYQLIMTFSYVSDNQRPIALLHETPPTLITMLHALFLPVNSYIHAPKTYWGWWEYSAYIGIGAGIVTIVILVASLMRLFKRNRIKSLSLYNPRFNVLIIVFILGILGLLLALGDFGTLSPYSILRKVPGFTQMRVSARWIILTNFALLCIIAAWTKQRKIINLLLLISVIELFVTYGGFRSYANDSQYNLPPSQFRSSFEQYDNNYVNTSPNLIPEHSLYFTTSQNMGQIYGSDSIVDTLNRVIGTQRCGLNVRPQCDFVLSDNAEIVYWSPNKIILRRTGNGLISINMNIDKGWRVNDKYIFARHEFLNPDFQFTLPEGQQEYTLQYEPKFSPPWIVWKVRNLIP